MIGEKSTLQEQICNGSKYLVSFTDYDDTMYLRVFFKFLLEGVVRRQYDQENGVPFFDLIVSSYYVQCQLEKKFVCAEKGIILCVQQCIWRQAIFKSNILQCLQCLFIKDSPSLSVEHLFSECNI